MDKLISMTDFVLYQENKIVQESIEGETKEWDRKFVQKIILYARFLKQPLTLGMFVPCDENGNVLQIPTKYKEWLELKKGGNEFYFNHENKICEEYHTAKERVLFEGFEYGYEPSYDFAVNKDKNVYMDSNACSINGSVEMIISMQLDLTETAKKQIYGK